MKACVCAVVLSVATTCAGADPALFCELYAPGHFGNWYEVAGEREMRAVLQEAQKWGFNCYGDWFDTLDCADPFSGDPQYALGNALWDAKKTHFRTAQSLGLKTDLVITPNHVFRDQLSPNRLAKKSPRIIGQLVCPSIPGGREVILDNHRRMLAGLASVGVRLTYITAAPYDYGGCDCERCRPWIITFARLSCDIHRIAEQYHPGIQLRLLGWWWSKEEHAQLAEWMDREAPGRAASVALHIPYGKTSVSDVPLPRQCEKHAFVHIGYADRDQPRDIYGRTGPVIAARRMEQTVSDLRKQSVSGVMAYSEGVYDDVNKALLGALWSGSHASADATLQAYAERYFSFADSDAKRWAAWVLAWGTPFSCDASSAKSQLSTFRVDAANWRWRQWTLKADMFVAHAAIDTGTTWTPGRLSRAEAFWSAYEELNRRVYGLGPLRHILGPSFINLPWQESWREHQQMTATRPASPDA